MKRIVAVTGANRGIGLALVKRLVKQNQFGTVILCSRNLEKGQEASFEVQSEAVESSTVVEVEKLDMACSDSIKEFSEKVKSKYSGIHALVNNAGINLKPKEPETEKLSRLEQFDTTLKVNVWGLADLTHNLISNEALLPKSKVINISSQLATSHFLRDKELKQKIEEIKTLDDLKEVSNLYRSLLESGNSFYSANAPFPDYSFSKILVSKYSKILAHSEEAKKRELEVYALCPGWVKTDMGGEMATGSVESGTNVSNYLLNLGYEGGEPVNPEMFGTLVFQPGKFRPV